MPQPASIALVLAAGRGSRMRQPAPDATLSAEQAAAAQRGLKAMMPDSAGRPFLDHILSSLADAGIEEVCLIVGADHQPFLEHYDAHPPRRVRLEFVVQQQPRGTADAVLAGEAWCAGRDFLVLNADNLYPQPALRALITLPSPGLIGFDRDVLIRESNIDADRVASFALLTINDDNTLAEIVEKPDAEQLRRHQELGDTWWISMNLWRFNARIFDACRDVPLSARGEFELPLAVPLAISRGVTFQVIRMEAGVIDLSRRDDVAQVASQLGRMDADP